MNIFFLKKRFKSIYISERAGFNGSALNEADTDVTGAVPHGNTPQGHTC